MCLGGAVLLACFLFFPTLALVVLRKWRLAVARREEIIRLVRLAVAEAEGVEREGVVCASAWDRIASVVIGGRNGLSNCVVCYRLTAARCARCKVVKYCSGKCQIIHWRKGHKDECHPPSIGHFKGPFHVADLKGMQAGMSEINDNWSEIEGHSRRNDDHYSAFQNVSNMEGGQAEDTIFGNKKSEIGGKLDGVESFKTSFNKSMLTNPASASGKELCATLNGPSASTGSTFVSSGEMSNFAPSNTGPTGAEPGQHSTASAYASFANPENSSSSAIFENSRTSIVSEKPIVMNVEGECRLNGPSNMKSSGSNRSLDVRLCQNNIDSRTADLTKISDEFENFKFSGKDNECQEVAAEILRSEDCTESYTPCNSNQSELDVNLHSNGSVKVSTPKFSLPTANTVRFELTDTKDLHIEKSCSVAYGENNKVQLTSLSSSFEDHLSASTKSLEISDSLLTGKVFVEEAVKQSSSSLRHVQPWVCNNGSLKYNYKMLFSYDLFIKLYNSDKVGLNPCGLINCGNRLS